MIAVLLTWKVNFVFTIQIRIEREQGWERKRNWRQIGVWWIDVEWSAANPVYSMSIDHIEARHREADRQTARSTKLISDSSVHGTTRSTLSPPSATQNMKPIKSLSPGTIAISILQLDHSNLDQTKLSRIVSSLEFPYSNKTRFTHAW